MVENEIKANDIADNLLILNKTTIDALFKLNSCSDCIALYVFYYKTAKWQKTNVIKATDNYVESSMNWSHNRLLKIKTILKEKGLIDIIQRRKDGKIQGWYVQVNYLVSDRTLDEITIKVDESKKLNSQQVEISTSCNQETNAYKEYIICLKKEIEMLKESIKEKKPPKEEEKMVEIPYKEIVDYLNLKIDTHYKSTTKETQKVIKARFNEGFTLEDFKKVIDIKTKEWLGDKKMCQYLRPETLFGNKFEGYLNQKQTKLTTKDIADKIDWSDY